MFAEWFSYKLAPDGDVEDGCHPEEAQALQAYLQQIMTATEAAEAITRPTALADNLEEQLPCLWSFLMDALVELPSEHTQPLIKLLQAIESLPEPDLTALEDRKQPSETLWKGLPHFGHWWSDSYQSGNWKNNAKNAEGQERDSLRNEHVRKAEIEARLFDEDLAGIPVDWGFEAVAEALESRTALLDFEVPAATEWLVLCGHRFRQGAEKSEESWALKPRSTSSYRDPTKAPEDRVMSVERWSLWEKRLQELEMEEGIIQAAAKRARAAMREADLGFI